MRDFDLTKEFTDDDLNYINTLSDEELLELKQHCDDAENAGKVGQLARKTLINSLYGAIGNETFRYYDIRNAQSITLFGQMAIKWIMRKCNEYLNELGKTENHQYVVAGDTDSQYLYFDPIMDKLVEKGVFKTNEDIRSFMDRLAKEKIEPFIDESYRELCEYMNNNEHLMFMDREAISFPPIGSDGIGGFWKAKKRYALNVWDMEGVVYEKPHLKIMGLETQSTATPARFRVELKECIRLMLQEGEKALQEYYEKIESEYPTYDINEISSVSSVNNIAGSTADSDLNPKAGTYWVVKSALLHNRLAKKYDGIDPIQEGGKAMMMPLIKGADSKFNSNYFAWESGAKIDKRIMAEIEPYIDYGAQFNKGFVTPLKGITDACKMQYKHVPSIDDYSDLFD